MKESLTSLKDSWSQGALRRTLMTLKSLRKSSKVRIDYGTRPQSIIVFDFLPLVKCVTCSTLKLIHTNKNGESLENVLIMTSSLKS